MRNIATNGIGYTGIVRLSQYINGKKKPIAALKNQGNTPLFNFISDCLLGDFDIAQINRPTKIMLLKRVPEAIDSSTGESIPAYYQSESGFIYLRSKPEKLNASVYGGVRYSFVIDRSMMANAELEYIALYSNSVTEQDINNFAAIVQVPEIANQGITSSSALVIDWELRISNNTSSNASNN